MGGDGSNIVKSCKSKNGTRNERSGNEEIKMNKEREILGIERATVYFVTTSDPMLNDLRRYAADYWVINYDGVDIRLEETKELEESFQILMLTNLENQTN